MNLTTEGKKECKLTFLILENIKVSLGNAKNLQF